MKAIKRHFIPKVSGINLIGLMISASLGAFILAVIVRVSFTVGDNFQIIKSITELESSARIITDFCYKVLPNIGYNNNQNIVVKIENSATGEPVVGLSFVANTTIDGILQCSRRSWPIGSGLKNQTIYFKGPKADGSGAYITCVDDQFNLATAESSMPIVSKEQIAGMQLTITVAEIDASNIVTRIADVIVDKSNIVVPTPNPLAYGVKIAILLRSTDKVFNNNRASIFSNIFGYGKHFNNNDQYLYKLVAISAPLSSAISSVDPSNNNTISIQ